ncbi:MAG: VRR-NUC domain-containing protein [Gammaproteobacteria bacterium]|nr:VRR-NUC domain-containing protein [Gammaproteobacteria bacterium]
MSVTAPKPLEAAEQALFFRWLDQVKIGNQPLRPHCYAIPNGGSRHVLEAANLRRQGVTAGVPDICIDVPSGDRHGLRIEMKRLGGKKPDALQVAQLNLRRDMGYEAHVAYGFDQARQITIRYLAQGWVVTDRWGS